METLLVVLGITNLFLLNHILRNKKPKTMTNAEFLAQIRAIIEDLKSVQPNTGEVDAELEAALSELQAETNRLTTSTTTTTSSTEVPVV